MQRLGDITRAKYGNLPSTSVTTTPQKAQPQRTGTQAGGRGLQTTSVSHAMAQASPETTDRALEASLTSLLGSKPAPIWEDRVSEAGWDGVVTGYKLPALTSETRQKALAVVEGSLTPMTPSECIGLLGELRLLVPPVNMSEQTMEAQIMLYQRKLADYPADVVRRVLSTQANISKFWPAWSELKERLDLFTARRLRLRDALQKQQFKEGAA